jgi:hypothetical protein
LSLSLEEIDQITKEMEDETKAIKDELFRFCWYMRGGVTITEAYNLSTEDREIIANIIEKNLEITKKTTLPFF